MKWSRCIMLSFTKYVYSYHQVILSQWNQFSSNINLNTCMWTVISNMYEIVNPNFHVKHRIYDTWLSVIFKMPYWYIKRDPVIFQMVNTPIHTHIHIFKSNSSLCDSYFPIEVFILFPSRIWRIFGVCEPDVCIDFKLGVAHWTFWCNLIEPRSASV